jgi:hypothetical protein
MQLISKQQNGKHAYNNLEMHHVQDHDGLINHILVAVINCSCW